MLYRIFLLSLTLWGVRPAHAQSVDEGEMELRSSIFLHQDLQKGSGPSAGVAYESYTSASRPAFGDGLYSSNALFKGAWQGKRRVGSSFSFVGDFAGIYSASDQGLYPLIKEAYFKREWSQGSLRLGVDNTSWTSFEDEWRLGLYRPRFMYNKLSGGQGGLLGFFMESKGFTVGFLPVFVPELGPHFENNDGELTSQNPWFGQLPKTINYNGSEAPIRYKVKIPPVKDIVLKPGLVASWQKDLNKNYSMRWSGAYKPMPQLLLNFPSDGRFVIGNTDQYFEAEVNPWVAYHGVVSTDHQVQNDSKTLRARISLAHEDPQVPERPKTWVTQEIGPATFVSTRFETEPQAFGNTKIFLSQFKVWGGDRPDEGRYASDESYFESRQFFREAYGLGFETLWPLKFRALSSVSVIYDRIQEGGALLARNAISLKDNLQLYLNLEFLGLLQENNPTPTGFLSRYRANDRAELGVTYAF